MVALIVLCSLSGLCVLVHEAVLHLMQVVVRVVLQPATESVYTLRKDLWRGSQITYKTSGQSDFQNKRKNIFHYLTHLGSSISSCLWESHGSLQMAMISACAHVLLLLFFT